VAIKTLPPEFARDPERMVRFRREARTLASLNHPNIAAIYGLEESGDLDCLVLEWSKARRCEDLCLSNSAQLRASGCASAGSLAQQRDHSPRPQASKRKGHARRQSESPRLRTGASHPRHDEDVVRSFSTTAIDRDSHRAHDRNARYMSPEQAAERPSTTVPISGVRCLLYELLTGKRAFAVTPSQTPSWRC